MNPFRKILIVRTDRIGDVVLTTPSLAALKKKWPQAHVAIMVRPATQEIVEGNPFLDEVIVYDPQKDHHGVGGFWRFITLLRKKRFDCAIIFHTKKRTNLICFFAGIPCRIGYRNDKFGFLLTDPLEDVRPKGDRHEAQYCLDVLKKLGVESSDLTLDLPVSEKSLRWAEDFFKTNRLEKEKPVIAIHPGASCISKRWPAQKFSELIGLITQRLNAQLVLIGGPETGDIARQILEKVDRNNIVNAVGETTLGQMAALLKRCQLLISNDSGPVHIACAVKTPVISIFGRNQAGLSPTRWRPLGPRDIVIHKEVGCEVCLAHNCQIDFKCLEVVSPEEILEATLSLFSPKPAPRST